MYLRGDPFYSLAIGKGLLVAGQNKVNATSATAREQWERQEGESERAFEAFALYRDMEPTKRSQVAVGRMLSKSKQAMSVWSSKWGWVRRARAWDDHRDAEMRESEIAERRSMGKRHARQAASFERILMEPAIALASKFKDDAFLKKFREDISDMSPKDVLSLIRACAGVYPSLMRAERLASGESTENVEGRVAVSQVKAVAARIAARAAKYVPPDKLEAFLNDLKADMANELGE